MGVDKADILGTILEALKSYIDQNGVDISTINSTLVQKGNSNITIGSYVGNGQFGSSNPNKLNFSFSPKVVFIQSKDKNTDRAAQYAFVPTFVKGVIFAATALDGVGGARYVDVSWSGNVLSWYCSESNYTVQTQLNTPGTTYFYVAIG